MAKSLYYFLIILSIIGLIFPQVSFAQVQFIENPEEIQELFSQKVIRPLLNAAKAAWEETKAILRKITDFLINIWELRIKPFFQKIWREILIFFGAEFEKRESQIEEGLKKEKEEIKKEAPRVGKSIWQRFKELFR